MRDGVVPHTHTYIIIRAFTYNDNHYAMTKNLRFRYLICSLLVCGNWESGHMCSIECPHHNTPLQSNKWCITKLPKWSHYSKVMYIMLYTLLAMIMIFIYSYTLSNTFKRYITKPINTLETIEHNPNHIINNIILLKNMFTCCYILCHHLYTHIMLIYWLVCWAYVYPHIY